MEYLNDVDLEPGKAMVLCWRCGVGIEPNPGNMCVACLRAEVDITENIVKHATLHFCKKCERYLQPPSEWVAAMPESRELLRICLKKIRGLDTVKLIDASFVWTEPNSKRIRVQLTVQGTVSNGTTLEQVFVAEFIVANQMCDDCHRSEANDHWRASVQVRQKTTNRKTFYYLEQLIMKFQAHKQAVGIKPAHQGVDFYYSGEAGARRLVDFLVSMLPCRYQHSKKLISHDIHSNTYNYKFTYSVELVPVSKDSVVCLPKVLTHQLGGLNPIALVYRTTSALHLIDVSTGQIADVSSTVYWRHPFNSICNPKQLTEYIVMDIEPIKHNEKKVFPGQGTISNKHVIADVWLVKAAELGINDNPVHARTHLGHVLKPGDSALGYAVGESNINDIHFEKLSRDNIPDIILVKKYYGSDRNARRRARMWKLKHLNDDLHHKDSAKDYEDFLEELEEDPEMRQNINIFRDETKQIPVDHTTFNCNLPQIDISEMLSDLVIDDTEMAEVHE